MFQDFGQLISRYDSSLPTLTDGQYSTLQVDSSGRLLVTADLSVVIDFLGLNGASDSSNILIVGTEDGTSSGTAHAFRLTANGSLVIRSLTFADDAVDVSGSDVTVSNTVTVSSTDFDIRDITHVSDSIQIGDGTDLLAVNADGSINAIVTSTNLDIRNLTFADDKVDVSGSTIDAVIALEGDEAYAVTDDQAAAGDGLVTITALATPWVDAITAIPVGVGEALHIYGLDFSCDQNAQMRLITDDGTDIKILKVALNSSSVPTVPLYFGDAARIEVVGAADLEVKLQIKKRSAAGNNALGSGSIHCRKLT
jgi:hypothetical protein